MAQNQLAVEIAREYEGMAIEAANQHYRLAQARPFESFSALGRHVAFCTMMCQCWDQIAKRLEAGPEMYETEKPEEWGFYD